MILRQDFRKESSWRQRSDPERTTEGLNGVNRHPSNGLKFNCQPSKMLFNINRQKYSNLPISADLYGMLVPKKMDL